MFWIYLLTVQIVPKCGQSFLYLFSHVGQPLPLGRFKLPPSQRVTLQLGRGRFQEGAVLNHWAWDLSHVCDCTLQHKFTLLSPGQAYSAEARTGKVRGTIIVKKNKLRPRISSCVCLFMSQKHLLKKHSWVILWWNI